MQKRRRILFSIIFIFLVLGIFFLWLLRGHKMMTADIVATNGSHYTMLLPDNMEPSHTNDSAASLEYKDDERKLYIEVVGDSKAKIISFGLDYDLDTYMKIATRQLDNEGLYVNKPQTINGFKSLQAEITKKNKMGQNIHYKLTCIETQKFFYQVLIYTPDNLYEKNKTDMEKMVASFKEK
jgi:hypothetical protein